MLVVFVNAHRHNDEGGFRFKKYYESVQRLLKDTLYYGNDCKEIVLTYDTLKDYLYDEITYRINDNCRKRFQSIEYIFIDGCMSFMPWDQEMEELSIFVQMARSADKKMHCNGLAHFILYFKVCTNFDKFYIIKKKVQPNLMHSKSKKQLKETAIRYSYQTKEQEPQHMYQEAEQSKERPLSAVQQYMLKKKTTIIQESKANLKRLDYQFEASTGNLMFHRSVMCNSGIMENRPGNLQFSTKSCQAIEKGVLLSTRFDYVVFDARSGSKVLRNVSTPFNFYWKSHWFCVATKITRAKVEVLLETEGGNPLAYTLGRILATQGLESNMLTIIRNWLAIDVYGSYEGLQQRNGEKYHNVAIDNEIKIDKSMRKLGKTRPQSVLKSTAPAHNKIIIKENLMLGRSRMLFCGKLDQNQIKNYVQRTPCRPPSSHKYREMDRSKWITHKDFKNC